MNIAACGLTLLPAQRLALVALCQPLLLLLPAFGIWS